MQIVEARAKVNLSLHVCEKDSDTGYHTVDSLVVFPDISDTLYITPSEAWGLEITGAFADGLSTTDNLVLRAAKLASPQQPYHIHLEKNLPVAAGIGGGSADAAAVIRALGGDIDAAILGADVPVCVLSQSARMQGFGEIITPVTKLPSWAIVLVNPRKTVSTREIFSRLAPRPRSPMPSLPPDLTLEWLRQQTRNDLQDVATHLVPDIHTVLESLKKHCPFVRMSGSGATCFGLFETRKDALQAADNITQAHPDWWVRHGAL